MKHHAKASSAGSSMRQAEGFGGIVRGGFVPRVPSDGDGGSGAPAHVRKSALVFSIVALVLLILAPSAFAAKGVVGLIGSANSGNAERQFNNPGDVAVNQAGNDTTGSGGAAAGDIYIVDRSNERIQQFSSANVFKRTFGLNVGGVNVNVCTASCSAGAFSGANAGMVNPQGIAIDQENGLVYVSDQGNRRIDIFSASGVFQGAFGRDVDGTTAGTGFEFCPAADTCQAGAFSSIDSAGAFGFELGYLAVSPSGDVLVADSGNRRVDQFSPTVNGSGEVTAVAFDRAFGWNVVESGPDNKNFSTGPDRADEVQSVAVKAATGLGTFKLRFGFGGPGVSETGEIQFNASAAQVETALNAITNISSGGGSVSVAGGPGDTTGAHPYIVTFDGGPLAGTDVEALRSVSLNSNLTATISTLSQGNDGLEVCNVAANPSDVCREGSAGSGLGQFSFGGPTAIAVDSTGASYVVDSSNRRVEKFGPGGTSPSVFAATQLSGFPSPLDVTVDRSDDHVFAIKPCSEASCPRGSLPPPFSTNEDRVLEFESSGSSLLTTHAAGAGITSTTALAEDESSGDLYMTIDQEGAHGALVLSSPPVLPVAGIDPGSGFAHTATTATFTGTVDPTGLATSCHFEYSIDGSNWIDADGAQGSGTLSAGKQTITSAEAALGAFRPGQTVTSSDGGIPAGAQIAAVDRVNQTITLDQHATTSGSVTLTATTHTSVCASLNPNGGAQAVSQNATGLAGSQLYHVRLAAAKLFAGGSATSPETTFTTEPGLPAIFDTAVDWSSITETAATIRTNINPESQGTSYHVEYVTLADFDESGFASAAQIPTGPSGIGNAGSAKFLTPQLTGLDSGTAYRARVTATNPSGTVHSATLGFVTFPDYGSIGSCPQNEAFRSGSSAALPDCRAFEQATPPFKNGAEVSSKIMNVQAALGGNGITFFTASGLPAEGSGVGNFPSYLSLRKGDTWTTQGLLPPVEFGTRNRAFAWTPDLRYAISEAYFFGFVPIAGQSLILRTTADLSNEKIVDYTELGGIGETYSFTGASADDSKLFLETSVPASAGGGLAVSGGATPAASKDNLYMYDRETGQLSLVGVLPDSDCGSPPCTPPGGSFAGTYNWWGGGNGFGRPISLANGGAEDLYFTQELHTISASGDKVFFTAGETGQIYLREGLDGASPTTVQVNTSQRGTPDPNGQKPARFMMATPSGSVAFFTSCQKLTDDSTAVSIAAEETCATPGQGEDLYSYDTESGELTDLTVDNADSLGAQVQGVVGTSDDGEYVYFVANGDLDGGGEASAGNCVKNGNGASYQGSCSLYAWHNGEITFVAPIDGSQSGGEDWAPNQWVNPAVATGVRGGFVSADGHALVFRSALRLTAYDNEGTVELYRYQAGDAGLECVSCSPSGAPPAGPAELKEDFGSTLIGVSPSAIGSRNLSAGGNQVFFQTKDKLVPADVNGVTDPYEWEAQGSGSCHTDGGCLYLLSTGTNPQPSSFAEASLSGDDVFVATGDQLVPTDQDQALDIYDASAGGGLASQHPVSPPPCEGEGCREGGTGPGPSTGAGTASFEGPGSPPAERRCRKGFTRRNGKCVKPRHHKRAHKHVNRNRGARK